MEYKILTQGTISHYRVAAKDLEAGVALHLRGGWRPVGGVACYLVDDRFVVMQAMVRVAAADTSEVQDDDDDS